MTMSAVYYSAARGGFFDAAMHADLPEDAVRIPRLRHRQLMDAQAQGRRIVANDKGRPVLAPIVPPSLEQLRAQASAAVNVEAARRILTIATLERQTNDNAVIAQAALAAATGTATPAGLAQALARRAAIDAVRAASNRIAATIAQMPAANLTDFDATVLRLWGEV
jgi:phage FluMu protein gp41